MNNINRRLNKALALLQQQDLDGLVIYSNGSYDLLRPNYLRYFSDFKPLCSNNAAILSRSGDLALLIEPHWDAGRARTQSWVANVIGTSNFTEDLSGLLHKFQIRGSVGVAGLKEMTEAVYSTIEKIVNIQPANDLIEQLAREKMARDIENVRQAAKIADSGFEALLEYARPGITEYELAAEISFAMRSAGADDSFVLLSSGTHNRAMHTPSDRRLSRSDIVLAEITPAYRGQFIQICRTLVLGKPKDVLHDKYDMLVQALKAGIEQVTPGVSASHMSKAVNKVISEAGYAEYCCPPYMRARGHGLGLGSTAPGAIIDDNTTNVFEKHQVIVVHPNQYLPETGYLACGETVLVTDSSPERLSQTETKLYVIEV